MYNFFHENFSGLKNYSESVFSENLQKKGLLGCKKQQTFGFLTKLYLTNKQSSLEMYIVDKNKSKAK